ncbi:methyltransferase domain protein [Mycobacterium xenopi 3993]|nr:methyltransferase domain protein [Mycobacterium xenopi 3993]
MLDLGAGTGKLTTGSSNAGSTWWLSTQSRNARRVAQVAAGHPALLGTAEEIPLPDNSVDAVLVAQAGIGSTPRARSRGDPVLRGGAAGSGVEHRDERLGWVRELAGSSAATPTGQRACHAAHPFTDLERHRVEWTNYLTPQALIDLVASRSYCITSPADVRTKTLDRVRELLATHPRWPTTTVLRCRTSRCACGLRCQASRLRRRPHRASASRSGGRG